MPFLPEIFCLPKEGNSKTENEDAFAYDMKTLRLAIADGASSGFASTIWANTLVEDFVNAPPKRFTPGALLGWLDGPIQTWSDSLPWDRFTYYQQEKANRGAYSTLLGITFRQALKRRLMPDLPLLTWNALAVGDTCLFQIRKDRCITALPYKSSCSFTTSPPLISTCKKYNDRNIHAYSFKRGYCRSTDIFFMMTDALAAWCHHRMEAGHPPWEDLLDIRDSSHFSAWISQLRNSDELMNDDVTLIKLAFKEDAD